MLLAPSRKMYRSTLTTENEKSDFSVVMIKMPLPLRFSFLGSLWSLAAVNPSWVNTRGNPGTI